MVFDVGSIGVSIVFTVIIVIIIGFFVFKRLIIPVLEGVIDIKLQDVENMMKAAASALGTKSGESRALKKMEKKMGEDLIAQFPEIDMVLEYFSPDTAEMMRANPERALVLVARWKPIIESFLGVQIENREKVEYDH